MRTVVWGAPCSGKTTYVREHAKAGDVICDYDALYKAISFLPSKGRVAGLKSVVFELIEAVYAIIDNHPELNAWIITASRDRSKVESIIRRFGAELVRLDISREEAHRRCDKDKRPSDWHGYIDKWFDTQLSETVYIESKQEEFAHGDLIGRMWQAASKELLGRNL